MAERPDRERLPAPRPIRRHLRAARRARHGAVRRRLARLCDRRRRGDRRAVHHHGPAGERVPRRRRHRLPRLPGHGRARHRAVLPHRLHPPAGAVLVPGHRGSRGTAGRRRPGGRPGLRPRGRDPDHGSHLAPVGVHRVRRRRAVGHRGPIPGDGRWIACQRGVPRGRRLRFRARPVRGRDLLRRTTRSRRPRGRAAPGPRPAGSRGNRGGGGAMVHRPARGRDRQPHRAHRLRHLHLDVHADIAGAARSTTVSARAADRPAVCGC